MAGPLLNPKAKLEKAPSSIWSKEIPEISFRSKKTSHRDSDMDCSVSPWDFLQEITTPIRNPIDPISESKSTRECSRKWVLNFSRSPPPTISEIPTKILSGHNNSITKKRMT